MNVIPCASLAGSYSELWTWSVSSLQSIGLSFEQVHLGRFREVDLVVNQRVGFGNAGTVVTEAQSRSSY